MENIYTDVWVKRVNTLFLYPDLFFSPVLSVRRGSTTCINFFYYKTLAAN